MEAYAYEVDQTKIRCFDLRSGELNLNFDHSLMEAHAGEVDQTQDALT